MILIMFYQVQGRQFVTGKKKYLHPELVIFVKEGLNIVL